jgi:hypothetical protein
MEIQRCEVRKGEDSLYKYWVKTDDGVEHLLESKKRLDLEEISNRVKSIGGEEICDGN